VIAEKDFLKDFDKITVDYIDNARGKGFSISTGDSGCGDDCSC